MTSLAPLRIVGAQGNGVQLLYAGPRAQGVVNMEAAHKIAEIEDPALAELVRRLVAIYQPLRIYLFGCHARGEAGPGSDYDLMVVVADDSPEHDWQRTALRKARQETRAWADVLVWKRGEFDRRLHLRASFPSTVVREGKVLYAV